MMEVKSKNELTKTEGLLLTYRPRSGWHFWWLYLDGAIAIDIILFKKQLGFIPTECRSNGMQRFLSAILAFLQAHSGRLSF